VSASDPTPAAQRAGDARTAQVIDAFETLTRDSLNKLLRCYADDARFKDPFNDVRGRDAIRSIFAHMFDTLIAPRFTVIEAITQGDQAVLTWDFTFGRRGAAAPMTIHGATHLRYADDGRITLHRDYWDAAEELYAKLPLLGALMRWLRRRLSAPQP
jgi:ketosteroid isomerase-like protein